MPACLPATRMTLSGVGKKKPSRLNRHHLGGQKEGMSTQPTSLSERCAVQIQVISLAT